MLCLAATPTAGFQILLLLIIRKTLARSFAGNVSNIALALAPDFMPSVNAAKVALLTLPSNSRKPCRAIAILVLSDGGKLNRAAAS